ncbi:rhodanese-like domain-containing protein [Salinisphaera hydrothermalis]|uniref:Molybdopterin biosynthesis protein MoeB n=1 Tax=Salinisphaera hydrothermalis (strain C41B8) TaxID=1304275 RepID=A0A084IIT4_SALHC|nr:rhodanese-like domain-containing protein [Salinisphaera hydrothermalis]KEZ76618.1 molybdopterin biosynthesis protein MoeB [Salinisphaera hydrothermalis C41B8]
MIDHHEAREAQENGAALIDVRERDEWEAGHVAGALFYPVTRISSDPDVDVDPTTPIVTYCKAGGRAQRAAEVLEAAGYANVRAMRGGFEDWRAAGYPTE